MSKNKNKSYHINLLLSEEDYRDLLNQEKHLGITTHREFFREKVREGFCYRVDYGGLYEVATQISRLGNNVNQIAKVANETRSVSPEQIELAITLLREIKKIANEEIKNSARIIKYQKRPKTTYSKYKRGDTDGSNEDN